MDRPYFPLSVKQTPEFPVMDREHPEYGTCPHCLQGKRLLKGGWLKDHTTPMMVAYFGTATFQCPGSGRRYAEYGEHAKEWNLRVGMWVDLPLDVPVIVREDPDLAESKIDMPAWRMVELLPATDARCEQIRQLGKGEEYRIEIFNTADHVEGWLVQIDKGRAFAVNSAAQPRAEFGIQHVVNQLLDTLATVVATKKAAADA